ncbi:GNAT family N-acetyltransferase [Streptomyces sp. NPDC051907]|uniref:GNAT family N-acetyltransferase n=1 Tax=Streptomyces sp. NPDC051907 TaxID=3155284 RepID=UPI00342A552D
MSDRSDQPHTAPHPAVSASASVSVRPYRDDDWAGISRVHDAARLHELRASVGEDAFLTLAQTYAGEGLFDGAVWVAEADDGAVAGFAALADSELTWLYVDPAHYRRGVGRALLRHALAADDGECVECTVLDGNDAARALYESEGFAVVETKTGRLAGNEAFQATGHIMVWRRPLP